MDLTGKSQLKAYKGTTLISQQTLPGIPAAIESFYVDEHIPKIPGIKAYSRNDEILKLLLCVLVIAVSIGPSVLFYRNMKPYYKYTLASLPIDPIEKEVWRKV